MITIFTPTYNRSHTIVRTYESLEKQTCKDFEWVVVDDGSSDDTIKVLLELKKKANFIMTIHQQENAGKHVAINMGVQLSHGELFFIVDSDDWLQPDAIAIIQKLARDLPKHEKYAGIAGVRVNPAGKLIGTSFDTDYIDCTAFERTKYNINGDKAEVYFTDVLRRFPFPAFAGEKFLTESVVWFRIAHEGYKIRWTNKAFYVCDYQVNGLSATTGKCSKNFAGYQLTTKEMLTYKELPFKERFGQLLAYAAISCKENKNLKTCANAIGYPCVLVWLLGKTGYMAYRIKNLWRKNQ